MTDAVDELEQSVDQLMLERAPDLYGRMVKARRERSGAPPGPDPGAEPTEVVLRVAPPPSDDQIAALLGGLLTESYMAATKAFQLARISACSGDGQMEDIHTSRAARLCRAFAELTVALSRHRGKSQRLVIEHHVQRGRVSEVEG